MLNVINIRSDFPILRKSHSGKPLTYLDSTATSLKPQSVIDKMNEYYTSYTANVFRGIYKNSERATQEYERTRETVSDFISATSPKEIVFTRNATESINLIAYSWGRLHLNKGDEIVTTIMEHHSNFVPWQQITQENGVLLKIWNCDPLGLFDLQDLDRIVTRKTKLFTITAVSNVVGTINPIKSIVKNIKKCNPDCLVLVDAAQAVPHMPVDVNDWGADFIAFSGHKMLGPTGIGVLWGKRELLEHLVPFQYGGDMIKEVHVDRTVFNDVPHKFEAGTPHIAGVIGLGAAVDYLRDVGMENIRAHEKEITAYALENLANVSGLTMYGPHDANVHAGVVTFRMSGIHPHDIAQILDSDNICIRVGFHCAQPLHEHLAIGPTARASFYLYTTKEDIDVLVKGLHKVSKVFK